MAVSSRSSSPSIEEIVEKLRGIKENSPELYKEAWSKIPHKTQTAILEYEADHEKSSHHHESTVHHKSSHETSTGSSHFSQNYPHASRFVEEHQSKSKTHLEARDWEAPARSHPHQPSTLDHDKEDKHHLSSPALTAGEDAKTETAKPKATTSSSSSEEAEKDLRKSVSGQIPKAHQIMKQAVDERHLPTTTQEVLLATTVYELELIRIGIDKLTKQLQKL